ncbi:hypothetical protein DWQ67_07340 [Galactobacter caseinivorans]|uniref:Aminoglycoside phosphotransferase domain-containing protein n=1 Tax=Galactobacter caseinivorans TaxID=2676123 RepID=A0A496PIJ3_9MICC|nr:hypothetical protein DWQ67_07340 [Galactobacter caseinivorans]
MRQWESSSWFEQVQDWISRVLKAYGVHQNGPLYRVTLGLGATVWTVPTSEGELYFKAVAPPRVHEAELVARVAPFSRGHIPTPLAVEDSEGWLLSPSIGTSLAGDPRLADLEHTRRVFADAAELQLALSDSTEHVAEGGLPGMLPDYVPEYLEEALTTHASLPAEHPLHVSPRDADLLLQGMGTVRRAAEVLAASPLPPTLQQGALAPEQVLVPSSHRAPIMFVGWGAARWAHPFELVGTAVEQLCTSYQCEPSDEPVRTIVSAYLAPFTRFAPQSQLEDLLAPALLLSHAQRHEALMDLLLAAEPEDQAAAAPEVMALLAEALAAPPATRRSVRGHASRRQKQRGTGGRRQGTPRAHQAPPTPASPAQVAAAQAAPVPQTPAQQTPAQQRTSPQQAPAQQTPAQQRTSPQQAPAQQTPPPQTPTQQDPPQTNAGRPPVTRRSRRRAEEGS